MTAWEPSRVHRAVVLGVALAACGAPDPVPLRVVASASSNPTAVPPWRGAAARPASTAPVVALAAGGFYTCARHTDGAVSCWGDNGQGQIGDLLTARYSGNTLAHAVPAPVAGPIAGALAIAAGDRTCAARVDGVWCWGSPAGAPAQVAALTDVVQLTSACARRTGGEVWCWDDALAAGPEPSLGVALDLVTSGGRTCALRDGGRIGCHVIDGTGVESWNRVVTGAVDIEMSARDMCARLDNGRVECWRSESYYDGLDVERLRGVVIAGVTDAAQVAMTARFACARSRDRRVRCWGLAAGAPFDPDTPFVIAGLAADEIVGGDGFVCARDGAAVWCFGDNRFGQLGAGIAGLCHTPIAVAEIGDAVEALAANRFSCARRNGGAVACWGQMPAGSTWLSPREVVAAHGAVALAGADELCARFADGSAACDRGMGAGLAPIPDLDDVVGLSSSLTHRVARTDAGAVWSFGADQYGQFGTGAQLGYTEQVVAMKDVTGARAAGAGEGTTCIVRADGTVACVGKRFEDRGAALALLPITGVDHAVDVAVGDVHACALIAGGTVRCWGDGQSGVLGRPATGADLRAQPVPGLADVVQLRASGSTTCARLRTGTVACWGTNYAAVIAEPSEIEWIDHPVDVGITDAVDLSLGPDHACAVLATGTIECWGASDQGQLGVLVPPGIATPQRVQFPSPPRLD